MSPSWAHQVCVKDGDKEEYPLAKPKTCRTFARSNGKEVAQMDTIGFNIKEVFSATMILFAVIDIMGNIPLIISLRKKVGHIQSEKATLVAAGIMILFLFVGKSILNLLGVDVNSFAVAGALILFLMALEMVLGIDFFKGEEAKTASIVPIAFPLLAGPGSMTALVSLRAEFAFVNIVIAILINCVLVYGVLKSASRVERLLGPSGINVLRKVFGIVLLAIAVKLFSENAQRLFAGL